MTPVIRVVVPAIPVPFPDEPGFLVATVAAVSLSAQCRLAYAARHLAGGNRNAGLFWAASRALEADRAAGLSPLAAAARQARLYAPEIARALNPARRTGPPRTVRPQAEGER